jgi:hypothetical protein
LEKLIEWCRE